MQHLADVRDGERLQMGANLGMQFQPGVFAGKQFADFRVGSRRSANQCSDRSFASCDISTIFREIAHRTDEYDERRRLIPEATCAAKDVVDVARRTWLIAEENLINDGASAPSIVAKLWLRCIVALADRRSASKTSPTQSKALFQLEIQTEKKPILRTYLIGVLLLCCPMAGASAAEVKAEAALKGDEAARAAAIARSLTAMLRASREVISRHQDLINDPTIGDKGLTGAKVLAEALAVYQKNTGIDPRSIDPKSWHGRLFQAQHAAIVEAVDVNQSTLNQPGLGFKGFIPSTFGRLVNEAFARRMSNEAEVKVTAPEYLIRNRKARPDDWEAAIIRDKLLLPTWPKGEMFAAEAPSKGRTAYRYASPEYYVPSCLACHGKPKGEIDITGHPKEGGSEGDLGAVISVTIFSRVH